MTVESIWQGKLVRLRGMEPEDWETVYGWSLDSELDRLSHKSVFPPSKEYFRKRFEEESAKYPEDDEYRWMIENLEGETVGNINTHSCDRRNGTFGFGLGINRPYWRRGYASEAIWLVLRFYFMELGYQKVNSGVYAYNEGSLALHRKLGFKEEGRLRRMVFSQGRHWDEVCFGMTREEFERGKWQVAGGK